MNTRLVNSAAGVVLAAMEQDRTAAGIALALESAQLLMSPETAAELAGLRARLADVHRMPQDNLTPAEVRLAQYGERTKTWSTATHDSGAAKALYEIACALRDTLEETRDQRNAARLKVMGLESRVSALLAERHSTNESVDDAAKALREQRDRIAELESGDTERDQVPDEYPPALPWAQLMDHEDLTEFLDELGASAITHASSEVALVEVEETCSRWRLIAEAQHGHNTAPGPDRVLGGAGEPS